MRRIAMRDNLTPMDRKCIEKGMTRKELSEKSGVPIRTLESWAKRERSSPNVYQLYKVAKILECHIEDLIEPEQENDKSPEA